MALTKDDRQWIQETVDKAVPKTAGQPAKTFPTKTSSNVKRLFVYVGVSAVAVTFFLAIWTKRDEHATTTSTQFGARLDRFDDRLRGIEISIARLMVRSLDDAAASSPDILQHALPTLRKEMEREPKANIPPEKLRQLAGLLQQVPQDSLEYWPTVLPFIQLASLPHENDVPPRYTPMTLRNVNIQGRALDLDHKNIRFDGGSLTNVTIRNSRIIFTDKPVQLRNVMFVDCVFEMPGIETPDPYLKQVAQQLLASNLGEIKQAP